MQKLTILALCFIGAFHLSAQTSKKYVVKAGEAPVEVLPNEAIYVLPVFKHGTVFFRDGSLSNQQLNYNYVLDEMQFIGEKGDTLTISEPVIIRNIAIDSLTFYYDKFYLQKVFETASFKLAVKQILVQSPDKTRGGYDVASASSSITTYGSITSSSSMYKLQVKKDVYFEKKVLYYLGNQYNQFVKADKKGFLTIFNMKEEALKKYIKDNAVNFNVKDDLEKLWKFCAE